MFYKVFQKVMNKCRYIILLLKKKLSAPQFLLLSCVIVGLVVACATVALKIFVYHLEEFFFVDVKVSQRFWYPPLVCLVGIGLTNILIIKIFKKNFLKGNDTIVYAIAKQNANLPFSEMYSPLITSGITVSMGGSAGLESPIVAAGAAIGSNIGRVAYLSKKDKTLLIACGIAAGISTAFSAPVAGVLFAVEVLAIDISIASFIPLLIAGALGSIMSQVLLGENILLSFISMRPFDYSNLHFYILLGVICGMVSLYYARVFEWMEHQFAKVKSPYLKWLTGSILLGILIIFFPPLFGEGYQFIKGLANTHTLAESTRPFYLTYTDNKWILFATIVVIGLLKVFATGLTLLGGGNGGSFAPSLFIGGLMGYILGQFCILTGQVDVPMANFIVAGMAGMLSGMFFAPLTAIFLSAELTNGYSLFIPLMLVAAISFCVVRYFEPLSMEMKKLKIRTSLNPLDKDHFLLSKLELVSFINGNFPHFFETDIIQDILPKIEESDQYIFAVVDKDMKYKGVLFFNTIKHALFESAPENKQITVEHLMTKIQPLHYKHLLSDALERFEDGKSHTMYLPIIDTDNVWLGFVSKMDILSQYRKEVIGNSY
ncbi:chloride channel protein [Rhizosphaericola mali]|uniref:Chloride channel protein n=1 Tax=Rhizosphaericola mali TaxID=2545455 RepID=A0A5P2G047_9BACT|nr:chloride channel protein [Rhizosphaericola mali]